MEMIQLFDIQEELKKLPASPGVYLMHDEKDEIIYVGKAISLKNRVRQYFQKTNKTEKIKKMVSLINRFEYIVTDSEMEALILECNLIKEHHPKYNTMLKDDKTYPYIKITVNEEYPRVFLTRSYKKDKAKYYGPFTNIYIVKETLELLRKMLKVRNCRRNLPRDIGKERPCLYYHIHQCDAPCQGYISKEDYAIKIEQAKRFLDGNFKEMTEYIENLMKEAAEKLDFELAMEYRELLKGIKTLTLKQKITIGDTQDRDIIALAKENEDAVIQAFFVRNGKMIGREHYYMQTDKEDTKELIVEEFIKQYYTGASYIPKEVHIKEELSELNILEEYLSKKRGSKVNILTPKRGNKEKLLDLAYKNALLVLSQDKDRIKREKEKTTDALEKIASILEINNLNRIEAYDISNINGFESVGSMIVYEGGKPKRNDYRKFKIKTIEGANDYGSLEEVLNRRFLHGINEKEEILKKKTASQENRNEESTNKETTNKETTNKETTNKENTNKENTNIETTNKENELENLLKLGSFTRFPDLIMMDGGKGQVNIALKVLQELKLDIPVCGMVKDDNHKTRGLYFNNEELPIKKGSEEFRLITRIQDEAHRFAIEYHRNLRKKGQVKSILDDIELVGPKRRKALMRAFSSLEDIKNAKIEELEKLPEINKKAAISIYNFFNKD